MGTGTVAGRFCLAPGGALRGRLRVPGDKSISHRAIMIGSLADGETALAGFLEGEDALATLRAFRDLGVGIDGPTQGRVKIRGVGRDGLRAPQRPIDLGNSGTSMRLLTGLLAAQPFASTLVGDDSLSRRPMRRVTKPLAEMGARIETSGSGTAPLRVEPVAALQGIAYRLPEASAQVKSSLLLAGLYAAGQTCVTEPAPTRDHTERMLAAFGYPVRRDGARVCLSGGGRLQGRDLEVPADISSAAFFLVGASIAPGSDLLLEAVGVNPTRTGVIEILRAMGADIEVTNARDMGAEPVADLRVRYAPLSGVRIPEALVPLAIDELPAVFVAAACADGVTELSGAAELRVKESDRIQVMAEGLAALGIDAQPRPDGIRIQGGALGRQAEAGAADIDSHGDHRVAMSFAIAALRAERPIEIGACANVATSFPGFAEQAAAVGLQIRAT